MNEAIEYLETRINNSIEVKVKEILDKQIQAIPAIINQRIDEEMNKTDSKLGECDDNINICIYDDVYNNNKSNDMDKNNNDDDVLNYVINDTEDLKKTNDISVKDNDLNIELDLHIHDLKELKYDEICYYIDLKGYDGEDKRNLTKIADINQSKEERNEKHDDYNEAELLANVEDNLDEISSELTKPDEDGNDVYELTPITEEVIKKGEHKNLSINEGNNLKSHAYNDKNLFKIHKGNYQDGVDWPD